MNTSAVAGLALPIVTAFLFLRATRWDRGDAAAPPALLLGLAIGLGLGISSCVYFVALLLADGARAVVIGFDVVLLVLASAAAWQWGSPRRRARAGGSTAR